MGAFALLAFWAWARNRPSAAVDLSLFQERSFLFVNLATIVFGIAFTIMFLSSFLFLMGRWGYSQTLAGLAVTPGPLMVIPVAVLGGRLAGRVGHRPLLVCGGILYALAQLWFFAMLGDSPHYVSVWLPGQLVGGFAVGLVLPSLGGASAAKLDSRRFGMGSGVNNALRQLGGALGAALALVLVGMPGATLARFQVVYLLLAGLGIATAALSLPVDTRARSQAQGTRRAMSERPVLNRWRSFRAALSALHPWGSRSVFALVSAVSLLSAISILGGCAPTSTSARVDPESSKVAAFRNADPDSKGAPLTEEWWVAFGDPVLDELEDRALGANLDVQIALTRVREARAGTVAARSRLFPTLTATGSASRQETGLPDAVKQGIPDARAYLGAISANWEIDLFGSARSAAHAAERDAQAADASVPTARLLLTTELARQYALWQGARRRLASLEALLQTQRDTERLTGRRESQGQASRFDVARAAGEAKALAAQIPPLQAFISTTEQQIAVLLGASPSLPVDGLDAQSEAVRLAAPSPSSGIPADLLRRRPDLQAAEQRLLVLSR